MKNLFHKQKKNNLQRERPHQALVYVKLIVGVGASDIFINHIVLQPDVKHSKMEDTQCSSDMQSTDQGRFFISSSKDYNSCLYIPIHTSTHTYKCIGMQPLLTDSNVSVTQSANVDHQAAKMSIPLRSYQTELINKCQNRGNVIVCAPPGLNQNILQQKFPKGFRVMQISLLYAVSVLKTISFFLICKHNQTHIRIINYGDLQ